MVVRAERCGRTLRTDWRGRPDLAAGHAISEIIDADNVQVDVAAGRVDKVIAADCRQVAVAADHRHFQFRLVHGNAERERQRSPMRRVIRVYVHIARGPAAAADPGNANVLVLGHSGCGDGMCITMNDGTDTTTRAQDVWQAIGPQQLVNRVNVGSRVNNLFCYGHVRISSRISSGVGMLPPAWFRHTTGNCVSRSTSRRN